MNRTCRVVSLLVGLAAGLVSIAADSVVPAGGPTATAEAPASGEEAHLVRVYYFHTTQRCASCRKLEALSEAAIREGFGRDLEAGMLEWHPVNTDEALNRHFIEDYQIYTKSLIVVDVVNGRQARWKNLPKIWEFLGDEDAFHRYVQGEVRAYLEKRQ